MAYTKFYTPPERLHSRKKKRTREIHWHTSISNWCLWICWSSANFQTFLLVVGQVFHQNRQTKTQGKPKFNCLVKMIQIWDRIFIYFVCNKKCYSYHTKGVWRHRCSQLWRIQGVSGDQLRTQNKNYFELWPWRTISLFVGRKSARNPSEGFA